MLFPETLTQAYHAGVICAMAHNIFNDEDLPSFLRCCSRSYALREIFGERMWQKMKSRKAFRTHITQYEKLVLQTRTPQCLRSRSEDFCLGYTRSYERSKRKKELDKLRIEALSPR